MNAYSGPWQSFSGSLYNSDPTIGPSIYSHALPADTKAAAKIWNDPMAERNSERERLAGSAG